METESVVTVGGRGPHGETGAVGDLVTDARSWAVKDAFAEKPEVRATESHALEELGSGESSPWLSTQSESASATDYFTAWGRPDDNRTGEALASLATERPRLVGLFTTASMVAAINSIVAGAGVVLAGVLLTGESHAVVLVSLGLTAAVLCMVAFYRYQDSRYQALREHGGKD
ncbi:hypothetical protein FNV62_06400 [Streptomyces sp. RLB3-17]|uniref:hypothetical protein n=1 Tax=unclassified Streptomyces TaxID=2593676 RepID=UPI001163EB90|nr:MULTISPECIES: hypothetical protein [unclassified Streptomyces]QDN75863.1 hypothetical protein FNV64_09970 [Streptomyces sp. S1A1-7]QDN85517.1 hypothetical protein FNV61_07575 [Streptomyces sp. RLB3-6]QDO37863.1 hypothetical protein FNV62_06400 [Streptomyces sp. RLB3-17]